MSTLLHSFHPVVGGAERQLQALIPLLTRRGVNVTVLTRRYPGLTARATVAGAPVHRMRSPRGRILASLSFTFASLVFLARYRRTLDVIHAHDLRSPTTTAVLAKLLLGRPVVVKVLRGGQFGDVAVLRSSLLGRLRLRVLTRLIDCFVVISQEIERELRSVGVPSSRIARIPNGVDAERFHPLEAKQRDALRRELELEGRRVALFVGRLEPEKGLDCLLDAWSVVRLALPGSLLVLVGDGSERTRYEVRRLPDVRFLGSVPNPLPYLQAADGFVLPSLAEGLSNALLEAMAAGLPCVTTSIGGTVDVVRDGIEGRLVGPGDASSLAAAIIGVLNGTQRERLSSAARARVIEKFSLSATADRLSELYFRLARKTEEG